MVDRIKLVQYISNFSFDDIRGLCLQMRVDYDDIPGGDIKSSKARELVLWAERRNRLDYLAQITLEKGRERLPSGQ